MNPEIKERWVAALRSGKYRQVKSALKRWIDSDAGFKHCCLGVLCDIVQDDLSLGWNKLAGKPTYEFQGCFVGSGFPTEEVYTLSQLPHGVAEELARMNDEGGVSFEGIADYIEENL